MKKLLKFTIALAGMIALMLAGGVREDGSCCVPWTVGMALLCVVCLYISYRIDNPKNK